MTVHSDRMSAAIQFHTAGDLQSAERIYREILRDDPRDAEALHLLGVIAHQVGQHAVAIELIQLAVAATPDAAVFHSNLGSAYQALGKMEQAVGAYRQAVRLNPSFPEAHGNLGNALHALGKWDEAIGSYQRALQLKPDYVESHSNLGNALRAQGRPNDAIASYQRALQLRANDSAALFGLGAALCDLGRFGEAVEFLNRAVQLKPDFAVAHNSLGVAWQAQGQIAQAMECYKTAARIQPDYAPAHSNLGNVLREQGQLEDAVAACREAIRLKPEFPEALGNLGNALLELGELEEAIAVCRRSVELNPNFVKGHNTLGAGRQQQGEPALAVACFEKALALNAADAQAHNNLAISLLSMGEFERGWDEYEWRWQSGQASMRRFEQPVWDGQILPGSTATGTTVLVHYEQGLGDTLQFMRYLPLVKERAATVIFECHRPLFRLLRNVAGVDQLIPHGEELPAFDVTIPLMSLPRIFGTRLDTIPADVPYLFAEQTLVDEWRARLGSAKGFRVGICWQGNPQKALDQFRSIPLSYFAALGKIDGIELISLQKGAGAEQIAGCEGDVSIRDIGPLLDEGQGAFMDTAAVMQVLDLVITCDTAIAHLAGALGVPVWVVLQRSPDWRWLRDREDSPWYPSMRLFRQTEFGCWEEVFERIAAVLRVETQC